MVGEALCVVVYAGSMPKMEQTSNENSKELFMVSCRNVKFLCRDLARTLVVRYIVNAVCVV